MQGIDSGSVMPPGPPGKGPDRRPDNGPDKAPGKGPGKTSEKPPARPAAASKAETPASTGPSLRIYNLLARLPGPKNFADRIFMFSFLGTQLPLFLLLLYVDEQADLSPELLTTVSVV